MPQTAAAAVETCSVCINWFLWCSLQLANAVGSNQIILHLANAIRSHCRLRVKHFNRVNSKVTKKPYNENPYVRLVFLHLTLF